MKEKFMGIPSILRKQIFMKLFLGILSLIICLITLFTFDELYFVVPFFVLTGVAIVGGILMLRNCLAGNYVEVKGVCENIENTAFRKRIKSVQILFDDTRIKVIIHLKKNAVKIGDNVILYVPNNAQVYEHKGGKTVCDFYALDIIE